MLGTSFLRQHQRAIIATIPALMFSLGASAEDTYNGVQLSSPTVLIGGATYSNVVVTAAAIVAVNGGKASGTADTYDPASNQLTIPAVYFAGTTYTNVVIRVGTLVSIGGVIGADTYIAPELMIPSVKVLGGAIYNDVVITVGRIIGSGGAMPTNVMDVYNPATNELTITAVEYQGKIYTNATITVGTVVSAGGSQFSDSILYSFSGSGGLPLSADGAVPTGGLVVATNGNIYGTTQYGGPGGAVQPGEDDQCPCGFGTVFEIAAGGGETVLHSFSGLVNGQGSTDGEYPLSGLTLGRDGDFYGTTKLGGDYNSGSVFKITPDSEETVIYSFSGNNGILGSPDGASPAGSLVQDAQGVFYGTTAGGGAYGSGTVFKITPAGVETVLYSFSGCEPQGCPITGSTDGAQPMAGLFLSSDGDFYGTTYAGGTNIRGTVFRMTPAGVETVLHSFNGNGFVGVSGDGALPTTGLVQGSDGSFYGTTYSGGAFNNGTSGGGTVFKITPDGVETVLHSFTGNGHVLYSVDGANPTSLIMGSDGNLYGTTSSGGAYLNYMGGTVFKITPAGAESVLRSFGGNAVNGTDGITDGISPVGLVQGGNGSLYGTTQSGGQYHSGSVFGIANVIPIP